MSNVKLDILLIVINYWRETVAQAQDTGVLLRVVISTYSGLVVFNYMMA